MTTATTMALTELAERGADVDMLRQKWVKIQSAPTGKKTSRARGKA